MSVLSGVYTNLPLSYQEMLLLVPEEIRRPEDKRHKAVYGLIQTMARRLEEARRVSEMPPKQYRMFYRKNEPQTQTQTRIIGIQQEMAAVKFRLEINDYRGKVEEAILENRMLDLYESAKKIDPVGVSRYERMIDKRMKKASG